MPKDLLIQNVTLQELQEMISNTLEEKFKALNSSTRERIEEDLLTRKETAKLLRISLPTLADWTRQGILKSINLGRRVLYSRSEVQRVLEQKGGRNV